MNTHKTVLFLCSGNYYRSRMSEEYFNFRARELSLPLNAYSQGLILDFSTTTNVGPLSPFAIQQLREHGIPIVNGGRMPQTLQPELLEEYELTIALSRIEHEPMLRRDWPGMVDRISFWEVGDIGVDEPAEAFRKIRAGVDELIRRFELGR